MSMAEVAPVAPALESETLTEYDGELTFLERGDQRIRWRRGHPSEAEARKEFERRKAQGFVVFKMAPDGKTGNRVETFDELLDGNAALMTKVGHGSPPAPTRAMGIPQLRGG